MPALARRRAPTPGRACARPGRHVLAARQQQLAKAVGDDGEHDVVDRAAERGADRLHVGQRTRAQPQRRCGPIGPLSDEGGVGRTSPRIADAGPRACPPAAERTGAGRASAARAARSCLVRADRALDQRVGDQLDVARLGLRRPRRPRRGRVGSRSRVEDHGEQVACPRRRRPCSGGPWRRSAQRPVLEAFDDPHLPQRLARGRAAATSPARRGCAAPPRRPGPAARCGAGGSRG